MPGENGTLCAAVAACLENRKAEIPATSVYDTIQPRFLAPMVIFVEWQATTYDDGEVTRDLVIQYIRRTIVEEEGLDKIRDAGDKIYEIIRQDLKNDVRSLHYILVPGVKVMLIDEPPKDKDETLNLLRVVVNLSFRAGYRFNF